SFSAPLVTGFAACVMQLHPDWNNMKVFTELEKSGHLYPYYDYAHGYGVPQAVYFLGNHKKPAPTFTMKREFSFLTVVLKTGNDGYENHGLDDPSGTVKLDFGKGKKMIIINNDTVMVVNQENKRLIEDISGEISYTLDDRYMYFHFADKRSGLIRYYAVIDMEDTTRYSIDLKNMKEDEVLMIHYRGYTASYSK
ncbi:MAG TPA: hypothetical protein VE870_06955, partial [Bacteroidales bacterium]|nr:hypothetical protein [Bacteroidales bacterium]